MKHHFLVTASLAVLISACSQSYAFPEKAPSSAVLNAEYKGWKHELTQNPDYHFSILIPNDWKVLQTTVETEPYGERPLEIALFREPGAWMEDESAPTEGEILVEVFSLSGSTIAEEAPAEWLKRKLQSTAGDFDLLRERVFTSPQGPAADLLVKTGAGRNTVISRLTAIRSPEDPTKIFVIASSAQENGYARVAEVFATAASTFRLTNLKYVPPMPGASTGALKMP